MQLGPTRVALTIVLLTIAVGTVAARPYAKAGALIVRVAGIDSWFNTVATWSARPVHEAHVTISSRYGPLRARLYRPTSRISRTALLVGGLHPVGIDEPRLRRVARELAATDWGVVTPDLPDLKRFQITPRATDMIEDSVAWLASGSGLTSGQAVGLMGISFSGGLALAAAGRPSVRDRLAFVLSLGGHGDLPRVLRYLCTGFEPPFENHGHAPVHRRPHDYGVAIILLAVADRLVPVEQVALLRDGILAYLEASALDMVDRPRAAVAFAAVERRAHSLPDPAGTLLGYVTARDVGTLGPRLLPHIGTLADSPALSPERSAWPRAPVYLLHGTQDNVIPAVESRLLARHFNGRTSVHLLLSELISHADLNRGALARDVLKLIRFWGDLLRE